jgi:hypothetical protein
MNVCVYAFGNNSTPIGFLNGNVLYDNSRRVPLASIGNDGAIYLGSVAGGCPSYFIVGNTIRHSTPNGRIIFRFQGNGICDGNGNVPTFYCNDRSEDGRIALALAAVANIGDMRFRPEGADVVDSRSLPASSRGNSNAIPNYTNVYGNVSDPFKNMKQPNSTVQQFGEQSRSESHYANLGANATPVYSSRDYERNGDAGINNEPIEGIIITDIDYASRVHPLATKVWDVSDEEWNAHLPKCEFNIKPKPVKENSLLGECQWMFTTACLFFCYVFPLIALINNWGWKWVVGSVLFSFFCGWMSGKE